MNEYFFEMTGRAFDEGLPIDMVANSLNSLQNIFDGSYKAITGKVKLSKKDRKNFRLVASEFKHSSFISNFDIITTGVQCAVPFAGSLSITNLWSHTKNAYDFLKALFIAAREHHSKQNSAGLDYPIQNNGDGGITITNGNQKSIYQAEIVNIGKLIINGVRDLDDMLSKDKVDKIEIGKNDNKESILLRSNEKGLFTAPTSVSEDSQILDGEIYDFNKYDKDGRIKIFENQLIDSDTYKFKVIGGQDIDEYILSMTESRVKMRCMIEYIHDPLNESKISRLLAIEVRA